MGKRVGRFLARVSSRTRPALIDLAGLLGCGFVVYGVHSIYAPAGFIVGGLVLIAGAWLLTKSDEAA